MLRVGLTGGLGSGKSTIGRMFAERGAHVIDADEVGRSLMQPGQPVYNRIVERFGKRIVRSDGSLDRRALAELAFGNGPDCEFNREALNRIVHPATIAAQEEWMQSIFATDPDAVAIVESALIFEASGELSGKTSAASIPGWRQRFDRIILVTAPNDIKIRRFVDRSAELPGGDPATLAEDARKRLAAQIPDAQKIPLCDWVIDNSGDVDSTRAEVTSIYSHLQAAAASNR
jgi:dephospho-CoA kinase